MTPRTSSAPGALSERVAEAKAANAGTALVPVTPSQLLEKNTAAIAAALPSMLTVERFKRAVLTEFRRPGSKLPECVRDNPASVVGAFVTLAQLGLEPGPLHLAAIVPRRENGKWTANPQIEYRGYIELAGRSGRLRDIMAESICENDEFHFDRATGEISHTWDLHNDRGAAYAYYAIANYPNGGRAFVVMNKSEVNKYKMRSDLGKLNKGPWATDYDQMAKKTCIRRLEPYLPKSTELAMAFAADERTVTQVGDDQVIEDDFIDVEAIDEEVTADGEIIGTPEDTEAVARLADAEQEALDGFSGDSFT